MRRSSRRGAPRSGRAPSGGAAGAQRSRARPANRVTTRPMTVRQSRCRTGDNDPATSPPSPAPTMPPRLNAAWKLGMMGRRSGHQVDGRAVEGDVDPAVGAAEHQQDQAEGERGVGQRGQRDAQAEQDRAGDGDGVAAVAPAEPAGERHGDDGTRRDTEQRQAQGTGRGAGLLLDGGDADDPAGEDEAVEGEEGGQGGSETGQVVAGARHGTVRTGFVYLRHKVRLEARPGTGKARSRRPGGAGREDCPGHSDAGQRPARRIRSTPP